MAPSFYLDVIHALRGWKNTKERKRKRKSVVDAMDLLFQIGFELAAVSPKRFIRPKLSYLYTCLKRKSKAHDQSGRKEEPKFVLRKQPLQGTQGTTFGDALFSD